MGRSCAALTGPTAEGEKGIGKLRVWAKSGLGGLRVGRAIGEALTALHLTTKRIPTLMIQRAAVRVVLSEGHPSL